MKIILDAMGGDNAPAEILKGAAAATAAWPDVEILAVGDAEKIAACVKENAIEMKNIEIVNATEVIEMCDEPAKAVRAKKDSSMVVGLRMLAEGKGDAFVSAGSTGALHVGASLIVRTVKGVKRPALATVIPGKTPFLLLDCGANVECRASMLEAFGVMGSVYMNKVMGLEQPRVALVNNGAEESKGTPTYVEAHQLLKNNKAIHFVGNIEPRDIPAGHADVVVADGFTGNVVLKLTEGLAKYFGSKLKEMFKKSLGTKVGYLLLKGGVADFKKSMDADEYGGAPLLGTRRPVIKAHGSSNARAIQNAIRQARLCVENDLCGVMAESLANLADEAAN
ncbi:MULTISPECIES: phosphate acyltransferase PlsX [Allofournierella]|uniref:phosphate acyltransferase PlsX n=1 Tax=Allofournierella TaxID=1940255 RepID=UPI002E7A3EB2|nr:phosphate acyltransferase PlsX [Fournierella sp.]MEE0757863.1 phosphate acyltransferase PlsX [Fournierella sp.]